MRFPLFIELENRPCLVVGGGRVAARKAEALAEFGARIVQVAPEISGRGFEDADVEGMALVVAATDDPKVNRRVADLCKEKGIPVNAVDDPGNCTFFFPAIARRGSMTIAASSGGACPVAAKLVRDKAAQFLSDDFVAEVERLGESREQLKKDYPDPRERMKVCEEALAKWKD